MDISYEVLNILSFLIPGFLASSIYQYVAVRKKRDKFEQIIEALIYSLIIYIAVLNVTGSIPVLLSCNKNGESISWVFNKDESPLLGVLFFSIVLPIVIGWINAKNLLLRLLNKIGVTPKTSRESVWLDVFSDIKKFVIINLKDGRRIYGWPLYFSNTPEEGMIYLAYPAWIKDEKYIDLDNEGIFLVEKENIESIEFLKQPQSVKRRGLWQKIINKITRKK